MSRSRDDLRNRRVNLTHTRCTHARSLTRLFPRVVTPPHVPPLLHLSSRFYSTLPLLLSLHFSLYIQLVFCFRPYQKNIMSADTAASVADKAPAVETGEKRKAEDEAPAAEADEKK